MLLKKSKSCLCERSEAISFFSQKSMSIFGVYIILFSAKTQI